MSLTELAFEPISSQQISWLTSIRYSKPPELTLEENIDLIIQALQAQSNRQILNLAQRELIHNFQEWEQRIDAFSYLKLLYFYYLWFKVKQNMETIPAARMENNDTIQEWIEWVIVNEVRRRKTST